MAETPSLAFLNLTGVFSAIRSLIENPKLVIEHRGFERVPVKRPWLGIGGREPLEAWVCPLTLSEETEPSLMAQFCGYDNSYCDKPFGRIRIDRGKVVKEYDGDAGMIYERMNLRLRGPMLVRGDRVLPRRSSVDIDVQSYEGAGPYVITRRDRSRGFGSFWCSDNFLRILPNEQLLYSEILGNSRPASSVQK